MEALLGQTTTNSRVGADDLADLIRSFNEVTNRLQSTHVELRRQVSTLQAELKSANAQLRRSRQLAALGEMAAGIAHEIRNPLGSIQLYTQVLADDMQDRPEAAGVCTKIEAAVRCLDGIVSDVLTFARDTQLHQSKVRSIDIIDRALVSCECLFAQFAVSVDFNRPTETQVLLADTGLLSQALANVIRNGVEAMAAEDGGDDNRRKSLWIDSFLRSVRCPDGQKRDRLIFRVRDAGPGIDPAVIERMFNPFFTTRKTGTGLGLAIVNRIVEAHGGHVAVANHEHGGAVVDLCLPSIGMAQNESHTRSPESRNHKSIYMHSCAVTELSE